MSRSVLLLRGWLPNFGMVDELGRRLIPYVQYQNATQAGKLTIQIQEQNNNKTAKRILNTYAGTSSWTAYKFLRATLHIYQVILDEHQKNHKQREIETVASNLKRSEKPRRHQWTQDKGGHLMSNDGNKHSPRLLTATETVGWNQQRHQDLEVAPAASPTVPGYRNNPPLTFNRGMRAWKYHPYYGPYQSEPATNRSDRKNRQEYFALPQCLKEQRRNTNSH